MMPRIYRVSITLAMFVVAVEAMGAGRKWS